MAGWNDVQGLINRNCDVVNLELANIFIDVIQIRHDDALVLHHVVQHGQPVSELRP